MPKHPFSCQNRQKLQPFSIKVLRLQAVHLLLGHGICKAMFANLHFSTPADHLASAGPLTKGLANTFALPLTHEAISSVRAKDAWLRCKILSKQIYYSE